MRRRTASSAITAAIATTLLLAACGDGDGTSRPAATVTATALSTPTSTATSVPSPTATPLPTFTPTSTNENGCNGVCDGRFCDTGNGVAGNCLLVGNACQCVLEVTPTATPTVDTSALPRYAVPGPYPVGYTTLDLPDRQVAVFYPARPGSQVGKPLATYNQADPLPQFLRDLLTMLAPDVDLTFQMTAYADLPAASDGPFPLVLFSHGFAGWRLVNSRLLAGVASWGFVVAAPDHLERGLTAVATGTAMPDGAKDIEVLLATRDLVGAPTGTAAALLTGLADLGRTAATGHSAGGGAALAMLDQPAVDAVVGYAAAGEPATVEHGKPTLLMAASGDLVVSPTVNAMLYNELLTPKRAVVIDRAGHNSFGDSCIAIRNGTDLVGLVKLLGLQIPDDLLVLATNGCEADNLDPELALTVIQHFTVAHLRAAFDLDVPPVGLGDGIATAFDGVSLTYQHAD
jgi:dienelactone hydrolase